MGFIEDCKRTESTVFNFETIKDERILSVAINKGLAISEQIDAMKKSVFYGKKLTDEVRESITTNSLSGIPLAKNLSEDEEKLLHYALGMFTEAGEFLEAIHKSFFLGEKLDEVNLKEEIGDMQWYQAGACGILGTDFETEQARVINKLKTRYPEKFTEENAEKRNLEKERKVLEDGDKKKEQTPPPPPPNPNKINPKT